ncbi:hypothetical protein QAD02_010452 [Eretmocerus hayati]|uniref:Uncharacterized protein n=1 Tax=Eretmocerus hayati TaxID=131215 RepID=A0ACC2NVN7_9HYME|nr:hypothetical protein QAD02_010452 [Eretmocerus hayati]
MTNAVVLAEVANLLEDCCALVRRFCRRGGGFGPYAPQGRVYAETTNTESCRCTFTHRTHSVPIYRSVKLSFPRFLAGVNLLQNLQYVDSSGSLKAASAGIPLLAFAGPWLGSGSVSEGSKSGKRPSPGKRHARARSGSAPTCASHRAKPKLNTLTLTPRPTLPRRQRGLLPRIRHTGSPGKGVHTPNVFSWVKS